MAIPPRPLLALLNPDPAPTPAPAPQAPGVPAQAPASIGGLGGSTGFQSWLQALMAAHPNGLSRRRGRVAEGPRPAAPGFAPAPRPVQPDLASALALNPQPIAPSISELPVAPDPGFPLLNRLLGAA